MAEKVFVLPGVRVMFHVKQEPQLPTALAVAGGRAPSQLWLQQAAMGLATYCADRGAAYALGAGLSPTLVVGDGDSAATAVYAEAEGAGAALDIHPPAKDDTDLQLLLGKLPQADLLATGIWGGRFDHLFSNVYSMLAWKQQRQSQVLLADDKELMVLLTGGDGVKGELVQKAKAVSLLPLSPTCTVTIDGVRWPLEQAELTQARPYAVSNEAVGNAVSCTCHGGSVGLYICWEE